MGFPRGKSPQKPLNPFRVGISVDVNLAVKESPFRRIEKPNEALPDEFVAERGQLVQFGGDVGWGPEFREPLQFVFGEGIAVPSLKKGNEGPIVVLISQQAFQILAAIEREVLMGIRAPERKEKVLALLGANDDAMVYEGFRIHVNRFSFSRKVSSLAYRPGWL
jgi:hypothetical protein